MSDSGDPRGDNGEDDCPLCLEPLPPFWDENDIMQFRCCGKTTCGKCVDDRNAFLTNATASGTWGKEEEQLSRCCPFCRSESVDCARSSVEKYETGQLPLSLYRDLGRCYVLGEMGVEQNVERGVEVLMNGAEKGDPNCQYQLGIRHYLGANGLAKSPMDGKRWLLAAAEQGHAIAEFNLALIARDEGDETEYLRYMRGSASKGYDDACHDLGFAHNFGKQGLQNSRHEATRVLTPAAERGHAQSMGLLGTILCINPEDSLMMARENPNWVEGMHLLRRASNAGDQQAVATLGDMEKLGVSFCFLCDMKAPPEISFLRCSRCRAAWYCSKDCQVQHWKAEGGHKQFCVKWCDRSG